MKPDIKQLGIEEKKRRVYFGMEEITKKELEAMLLPLGYKLVKYHTYINRLNKYHYPAASFNVVSIESGKNFSNIGSPKEWVAKLQDIRMKYFFMYRGYVSEF